MPITTDWARHAVRVAVATTAMAVLISLSACGGGDVTFDVGVLIGGQPVSGVVIQPGAPERLSIAAGQSIELDASESVQWTLMVGGSAITSSGATVNYEGVDITVTALSSSRIAIDTYAPYALVAPVPITLTAVSTFDSALVAAVDILITN
jgi:hypothetical protein